jgi:hypothetical protein
MSVEELEAEVIRTKAIYRQAQEEFTELQQLNMVSVVLCSGNV